MEQGRQILLDQRFHVLHQPLEQGRQILVDKRFHVLQSKLEGFIVGRLGRVVVMQ